MTLPKAMAVSPFFAAMTDVKSSGKEVPKATIVTATTDCLIPMDVAMPEAPLTKSCPPIISTASPTRKMRVDFHIGKIHERIEYVPVFYIWLTHIVRHMVELISRTTFCTEFSYCGI